MAIHLYITYFHSVISLEKILMKNKKLQDFKK